MSNASAKSIDPDQPVQLVQADLDINFLLLVNFLCTRGPCNSYMIHLFVNSYPNNPWFSRVCSTSLLKTLWEKEKLLITSNFSFSHNVFHPFGELSSIFIKFSIVFTKLFHLSFGKG